MSGSGRATDVPPHDERSRALRMTAEEAVKRFFFVLNFPGAEDTFSKFIRKPRPFRFFMWIIMYAAGDKTVTFKFKLWRQCAFAKT